MPDNESTSPLVLLTPDTRVVADGGWIFIPGKEDDTHIAVVFDASEAERTAVAGRIVSCVNACAGYATEQLADPANRLVNAGEHDALLAEVTDLRRRLTDAAQGEWTRRGNAALQGDRPRVTNADRERMVACLNACADIPTERLSEEWTSVAFRLALDENGGRFATSMEGIFEIASAADTLAHVSIQMAAGRPVFDQLGSAGMELTEALVKYGIHTPFLNPPVKSDETEASDGNQS